jgi:predicted AAA+ superfamily ATPase
MVNRLIKPSKLHSFFIFGSRGSGKSTWLKRRFHEQSHLYIDLLDLVTEDLFRSHPEELKLRLEVPNPPEWVIIDEVQKLPRLLDLVHQLIEEKKAKFVLSGSSARKLKRGSANLLAGRAFVYHLYPLTSVELGEHFRLQDALNWGTLPKLLELPEETDKSEYLKSYALTYLKEEIQVEQLVRNLDPFRQFLEVAAQSNSQIVNYSKIAKDIGVDTTTVQNYFSILEDTLIGFFLPPYHASIRKRQRESPKFYFFDSGVSRALSRTLHSPLVPQTYAYGKAFEHWVILEIVRLADYARLDWRYSYLRTKDDAEIDLIIDRPGEKTVCVEIKSSERIGRESLNTFIRLSRDVKSSESYCFSLDPHEKKIEHVSCLHWQEGLKRLGLALM